MADIELEDLGGAEAETVPTVVIANPSLKTTDLGTSQVPIEQEFLPVPCLFDPKAQKGIPTVYTSSSQKLHGRAGCAYFLVM